MLPPGDRPTIDETLARQITDWAITGRYPVSDDPLPTEAEVVAALAIVGAILGRFA